MTLLISVFAAIIVTIVWYKNAPMVDAIFEYAELKEAFFQPETADMINDSFLGLTVVALGLIIWLVVLLVKDPKGVLKNALRKNENKN